MNIPYRTRRKLNRIAIAASVVVLVGSVVWLCWVVWIQRYVVYTDDGATLNFDRSANDVVGEVAHPPVVDANVRIFFNEGADAINTSNDLTAISGYYISADMFQDQMDEVTLQVERLTAGTAVMIDMKGAKGNFYYDSTLSDAATSQNTDIAAVSALVERLKSKGFYTIARISAFRDYYFFIDPGTGASKHVSSGLYLLSKAGLWMDEGGSYWLDPTNATSTSWVSSVVLELRDMGFDEVLLMDFRFPSSDKYIFTGDKTAALQSAASTLQSACSADDFVLSFCVEDPTFPLPGERCRLYLESTDAGNLGALVAQVTVENPEVQLVFLADSGDTRYDDYSVLRTIGVASEVEARKGN